MEVGAVPVIDMTRNGLVMQKAKLLGDIQTNEPCEGDAVGINGMCLRGNRDHGP